MYEYHVKVTKRERTAIQVESLVCLYACVMFFALQLDRGNLPQALAADMLPHLGLTTNDLNIGNTICQLCFIAAELPSQLVSKKVFVQFAQY